MNNRLFIGSIRTGKTVQALHTNLRNPLIFINLKNENMPNIQPTISLVNASQKDFIMAALKRGDVINFAPHFNAGDMKDEIHKLAQIILEFGGYVNMVWDEADYYFNMVWDEANDCLKSNFDEKLLKEILELGSSTFVYQRYNNVPKAVYDYADQVILFKNDFATFKNISLNGLKFNLEEAIKINSYDYMKIAKERTTESM